MSVFGELIGRAGSGKLTIDTYFRDSNMQRFVPMLAVEDLTNMADLKCEGDDKEDEFDEIMEVVKTGIENEIKEWNDEKKEFENNPENDGKTFDKKEPKEKLTLKQKRFFKKACLQPNTWKQEQDDKIAITKEGLNTVSPLLGEFFDKIHIGMRQCEAILSYGNNNGQLTDEQQKAIALAQKIEQNKALDAPAANDDDDDKKADDDNDNENDNDDPTVITDIQAPNNDERALQLMNGFDDKNKKLVEQNMALSKAAIVSINVVDDMKEKFSGDGNIARAKGLADGVEQTCMNIIRSTATIRQSLLLGQAILQLKPANLNDRSKQLWNAVDDGIIQIFQNALEMSKVTAEYFGYFFKFKQSFNYYIAARDKSLMLSTDHLQKDIREFDKMALNFGKQVNLLGESAMKCIESCVRNTAGAENFEKNRGDRQHKLDEYLKKKKIYDTKQMQLDAEYGDLLEKRADLKAKVASLKLVIDSLNHQINHDIDLRNTIENTLNALNKIVV